MKMRRKVQLIMIQSSRVLYQPRPFPSLSVSSWIRSSPVNLLDCYKTAPLWYCTEPTRGSFLPMKCKHQRSALGRWKNIYFWESRLFFGCEIVSSFYVSIITVCPWNFNCLSVQTFFRLCITIPTSSFDSFPCHRQNSRRIQITFIRIEIIQWLMWDKVQE